MAQAANFGSILDVDPDLILPPKLLPVGTYLCLVQGLPRLDKSSKKQTEFVEFTLKVLEAYKDVDADELEEIGGIVDKTIKATYYLTPDSTIFLKNFLFNDLGLENEGSLRPSLEKAMGNEVLATVRHEPSQDGTRMFARVGSTAPVPTQAQTKAASRR